MFQGSMVALVTPFINDTVDIKGLHRLVDYHIRAKTSAIVAAGTTGEAGTLTTAEKKIVIETVISAAAGRVPVIAGTAANATRDCIELTAMALACGADAALIMTPAYIKPTQLGLYYHYQQIASQVNIPIILYNVPARTACDLLPETVIKLANIDNIIAIKEATGDITRLKAILSGCKNKFDVYSGDDITAAQWLLAGATGVVSVTANVAAEQMTHLCQQAAMLNDVAVQSLNDALLPLHHALFLESNPIPVKWALYKMGLIADELRLPLRVLTSVHKTQLELVLQRLQLI